MALMKFILRTLFPNILVFDDHHSIVGSGPYHNSLLEIGPSTSEAPI